MSLNNNFPQIKFKDCTLADLEEDFDVWMGGCYVHYNFRLEDTSFEVTHKDIYFNFNYPTNFKTIPAKLTSLLILNREKFSEMLWKDFIKELQDENSEIFGLIANPLVQEDNDD